MPAGLCARFLASNGKTLATEGGNEGPAHLPMAIDWTFR